MDAQWLFRPRRTPLPDVAITRRLVSGSSYRPYDECTELI